MNVLEIITAIVFIPISWKLGTKLADYLNDKFRMQ